MFPYKTATTVEQQERKADITYLDAQLALKADLAGATATGAYQFTAGAISGENTVELTGIDVNGTTYDAYEKITNVAGTNRASLILNRHSTTLAPLIIGARSNADTTTETAVTAGQELLSLWGVGITSAGGHHDIFGTMDFVVGTGSVSATSSPGKFIVKLTPDGSNTPAEVLSIDSDGTATFAGSLIFSGGITIAGQLKLPDGSVGAPALTNTGDLNTGLYFSAADTVDFSAGGVNALSMTATVADFAGQVLALTAIIGDPGSEGSGIDVNGATYDSALKVTELGGSNIAQFILHRHSTTLPPLTVTSRSNSDDSTHAAVTAGQTLHSHVATGYTGTHYDIFGSALFLVGTGTVSATSSPGKWELRLTPDGSNTDAAVITADSDKSVLFGGDITLGGTTPRVFADMSNATHANLLMFQNSVVNGNSTFGVIPNGTGTAGANNYYGSSDPDNATFLQILALGNTETRLYVGATGTGVYAPFKIYNSATEYFRLTTSGDIAIASGKKLFLDGVAATGDTYLYESAANACDWYVGGTQTLNLTPGVAAFADGAVGAPSITNIGDTDTGMYFSAADTIDFATGGTRRFSVGPQGEIAIGGAAVGVVGVYSQRQIQGGVSAYAFVSDGTIDSAVTTDASVFFSNTTTEAAAFTLGSLFHFRTQQNTLGAGSAVTNQFGFYASSSLTGAATNYGFYADLAESGTARWNFYANGTAPNYFAGVTGIGVTASTTAALTLAASTTGVASLRIPHGSAPTSPVDGDIWTTTAGLYVRINGATVGPLS